MPCFCGVIVGEAWIGEVGGDDGTLAVEMDADAVGFDCCVKGE